MLWKFFLSPSFLVLLDMSYVVAETLGMSIIFFRQLLLPWWIEKSSLTDGKYHIMQQRRNTDKNWVFNISKEVSRVEIPFFMVIKIPWKSFTFSQRLFSSSFMNYVQQKGLVEQNKKGGRVRDERSFKSSETKTRKP